MLKADSHSTTRARRHQRPAANIAAQIEELLRIRQEAEETATFLIEVLDDRDDNPDLEDGGDDEPSVDDEPSLGATHHINQDIAWHCDPHVFLDAEDEHDGREPEHEGDELDMYGEGALAPEKEYRERLRQRRGDRIGRAAS